MAIESTLLIVKPDGVRRGLVGEVLRRVEAKGLTIEAMRLFTIDRALAEEHYGEHVDKPFFGELVDFITGGPVVVAKVSGESAIDAWRTLMGPDEPDPGAARVDPGRLRHVDRREHRARERLSGLGRARARIVLPRGLATRAMPGLADAFERIGTALEHHLPVSHAAGAAIAITDRHETLGVVVRGFADVASGAPVRPETRFMIGSISKSFAAIVVLQEVEAGRRTSTSPERTAAVAGAPGAVRADHAAPSADPHERPGRRHRGRPDRARRRQPPAGRAPDVRSGGAFLVFERRVQARGAGAGTGDVHAGSRADPRASVGAARHDVVGGGDHRDLRTDLATGYEPVFSDRPAQLRHPLVPAIFTVSSTVDGSIVSNVIDMAAHARLLLNRGRGPIGAVLSEAMFDVLTTPYVAASEDVDTRVRLRARHRRGRARHVDRTQRRHGRLHGVPLGGAGERARHRDPAERVGG